MHVLHWLACAQKKRDFDHVITFPDHCTANKLKHTCQRLCGHSPSHPFLRFEQVAAPVESSCKVHD